MERITDHAIKRLGWLQPKTFLRSYELSSKNRLFGRLRFEGDCGTLAMAETADGRWTFKRVGLLNPYITIRNAGDQTNLAVFEPKLFGNGALEFSSGKCFYWIPLNFWRTAWGFSSSADQLLYRLIPGSENPKWKDILKDQAIIDINEAAFKEPDLPLLICTGWYLSILQKEGIAAITAVTAATAAV